MKKLCALVLLLGSLAVVPGCQEKCYQPGQPYFNVLSLQVRNIVRPDTSWILQSYHFPQADSALPQPATRFGINLDARITYHAEINPGSGSFGALMACDPAPSGTQSSLETISEIKITSDLDFTANHPAGTSLSNLFKITAVSSYSSSQVPDLWTAIPISEFLSGQPKARRSLQLWLTQRPGIALSHRFTVVYRQTNGEEYVVTTPPVTFQ